jgi:iron(III) transport system permease protein
VSRPRAPLAIAVPALAAVALVLLPLAYLVVRAAEGGSDALAVLTREGTLELVARTGLLVAAVTACATFVGLPLAWLVTRTDLPGRRVVALLAPLPLVIPSYVAALALLGAFGPRGLLQSILEGPFGVERLPEIYGFVGATLALTLSTYPYVYLLTATALHGLDPALEEAARGLGHSQWAVFRRVTLPTLRPSLGAATLLVALYALSDFGAVSLMQFNALTRSIYLQYRSLFDRTPAAVLGLVLVAFTIALLVLEERSRRGVRVHRSTSRPVRRVQLGAWRWPAVAFCTVVLGLFLVVPLVVLVYWSARAIPLGYGIGFAWEAALSSLSASALAAVVAVVAVVPVAFLAQRYPRPWTNAVERLAFTGNALPGIVIALSLVFFAANYASPLYQTLALLVFAYVVRFFPQALATVGAALHGVNPRVEEAARGLGRGPIRTLSTVTLPLIRPGLLAGGALVFLNAMKELPATLLLRPIGFETLATEIWKYTSLGSYSRAAPPALLLILVSAPFVYLLGRRGPDVSAPG